jgi:hypothetical protein
MATDITEVRPPGAQPGGGSIRIEGRDYDATRPQFLTRREAKPQIADNTRHTHVTVMSSAISLSGSLPVRSTRGRRVTIPPALRTRQRPAREVVRLRSLCVSFAAR